MEGFSERVGGVEVGKRTTGPEERDGRTDEERSTVRRTTLGQRYLWSGSSYDVLGPSSLREYTSEVARDTGLGVGLSLFLSLV